MTIRAISHRRIKHRFLWLSVLNCTRFECRALFSEIACLVFKDVQIYIQHKTVYVPFEGRIENEVPSLPLTIFHEKSAAAFLLLLIVTTPRKPEKNISPVITWLTENSLELIKQPSTNNGCCTSFCSHPECWFWVYTFNCCDYYIVSPDSAAMLAVGLSMILSQDNSKATGTTCALATTWNWCRSLILYSILLKIRRKNKLVFCEKDMKNDFILLCVIVLLNL